jgi:hypothetical protein
MTESNKPGDEEFPAYLHPTLDVPPSNPPLGALPFMPIEAAYRNLMQELFYAHDLFKSKGDGGVIGCITGCEAIIHFLRARHENPELGNVFIQIMKAFKSAQEGKYSEQFEVRRPDTTPKSRARSQSRLRRDQRLWAAVCAEMRMKWGASREEATAKVARYVAKWPYMKDSRTTALTIRNWRNDFSQASHPAHQQYLLICNHVLARPDARDYLDGVLK